MVADDGDGDQLVVEVASVKLSRTVYNSSGSGSGSTTPSVLGHLEASYGGGPGKVFRTREAKLYAGTVFGLPFHAALDGLALHVAVRDRQMTVDIGPQRVDVTPALLQGLTESPHDIVVNVTRNRGQERVGKVLCRLTRMSVFAGSRPGSSSSGHGGSMRAGQPRPPAERMQMLSRHGGESSPSAAADDLDVLSPLPDFRFQPLRRPIHWERLKEFNIDRVMRANDVSALLALTHDVAQGDVSQEEVDPRLAHALRLGQYSVQYILSCQQALKSRQTIIADALRVLEAEEHEVDVRLAKLRAREKALKREGKTLDFLKAEHTELLATLDPALAKGYRKSLHLEAHPEDAAARGEVVQPVPEAAANAAANAAGGVGGAQRGTQAAASATTETGPRAAMVVDTSRGPGRDGSGSGGDDNENESPQGHPRKKVGPPPGLSPYAQKKPTLWTDARRAEGRSSRRSVSDDEAEEDEEVYRARPAAAVVPMRGARDMGTEFKRSGRDDNDDEDKEGDDIEEIDMDDRSRRRRQPQQQQQQQQPSRGQEAADADEPDFDSFLRKERTNRARLDAERTSELFDQPRSGGNVAAAALAGADRDVETDGPGDAPAPAPGAARLWGTLDSVVASVMSADSLNAPPPSAAATAAAPAPAVDSDVKGGWKTAVAVPHVKRSIAIEEAAADDAGEGTTSAAPEAPVASLDVDDFDEEDSDLPPKPSAQEPATRRVAVEGGGHSSSSSDRARWSEADASKLVPVPAGPPKPVLSATMPATMPSARQRDEDEDVDSNDNGNGVDMSHDLREISAVPSTHELTQSIDSVAAVVAQAQEGTDPAAPADALDPAAVAASQALTSTARSKGSTGSGLSESGRSKSDGTGSQSGTSAGTPAPMADAKGGAEVDEEDDDDDPFNLSGSSMRFSGAGRYDQPAHSKVVGALSGGTDADAEAGAARGDRKKLEASAASTSSSDDLQFTKKLAGPRTGGEDEDNVLLGTTRNTVGSAGEYESGDSVEGQTQAYTHTNTDTTHSGSVQKPSISLDYSSDTSPGNSPSHALHVGLGDSQSQTDGTSFALSPTATATATGTGTGTGTISKSARDTNTFASSDAGSLPAHTATTAAAAPGADEQNNNDDGATAASPPTALASTGGSTGAKAALWSAGRAPMEAVETGQALDVFVSAVKLHDGRLTDVCLQMEFLGVVAPPSPRIPPGATAMAQPINYSHHIVAQPDLAPLLTEIKEEGEYISLRINVVDADRAAAAAAASGGDEDVVAVAQGSVALWVMLEDGCNIVRREVDLEAVDGGDEVLGFVMVDVRGHRFLKQYA